MSLTRLAEIILANAKELDQRAVVDPDSNLGFRNLAAKDYEARATLIQAVRDLERLSLGPLEFLHNMALAPIDGISLHAAARYGIPVYVPDSGISVHDLAILLNFDEENLHRLLGHAICNGIFQEHPAGLISHTPLSRLMRNDPDSRGMIQFLAETLWPTVTHALDGLEKWPGSRDPAHTAWALSSGSSEGPFEAIAKHPEKVEREAGYYRAATQLLVQGPDSLDRSPLWRDIDKPGTTVVDIGGSGGHVSLQLARATKNIKFVVQDHPEVVAGSDQALPAEFKDRLAFEAYDVFEEQPRKDADVYFLRKILHQWPDYLCFKILRNLIPALKDGAQVVLCEHILPEKVEAEYAEKTARNLDILMMTTLNGKERTMSEWIKLFAVVDSRFDVTFERWACSTDGMVKASWKP